MDNVYQSKKSSTGSPSQNTIYSYSTQALHRRLPYPLVADAHNLDRILGGLSGGLRHQGGHHLLRHPSADRLLGGLIFVEVNIPVFDDVRDVVRLELGLHQQRP